MRKYVLMVCIMAISLYGGWSQHYGGSGLDAGASLCFTSTREYLVCGITDSYGAGSSDFYLLSIDSDGYTNWSRTYGGVEAESGYPVLAKITDGSNIIAGYTQSYDAGYYPDILIVKVNTSGDLIWNQTYGGDSLDHAYSIIENYSEELIIAGVTASFGSGNGDVYIIKTDLHGDTVWTRAYGGDQYDEARSMVLASDSTYMIAGFTWSFGTTPALHPDFYLLKVNGDGDTLWSKTYGGDMNDKATGIVNCPDGCFMIVGYSDSYCDDFMDIFVVKIEPDGDEIWSRSYNIDYADYAHSIIVTSDNCYMITGSCRHSGPSSGKDAFLLKIDDDGEVIWSQTYGGDAEDVGYCVVNIDNGGYAFTGWTHSFDSEYRDLYLVTTDSLGNMAIDEMGNSLPDAMQISLYPNPFNSSVSIDASDDVQSIKIYDIAGDIVDQIASDADCWRPDESVSSGIYIIKALTGDGPEICKKAVYLK